VAQPRPAQDGDSWGRLIEDPPEVFLAADLPETVRSGVTHALLAAAGEWGNYGPLEYWVLGTDVEAAEDLARRFCERRAERGDYPAAACFADSQRTDRDHNFEYYRRVGADALASGRGGSAMGLNGNREWGIHLYSSSYPLGFEGLLGVSPAQEQVTVLHEYFHAVQSAHIYTRDHARRNELMGPVWFVEGGADYMAEVAARRLWATGELEHLGDGGRPSFEVGFEHRLRSAKEKVERNCPGVRLHEFSYENHCEGAAFDLGAWAIAYLLSDVGHGALLDSFYPRLEELGWEGAFQQTFGRTSAEFSEEFALFLERPLAEQLEVLPEAEVPKVSIHDVSVGLGACCSRCSTIWGADDLQACKHHREVLGYIMYPPCERCAYHGAYKYIHRDSGTKDPGSENKE